MLGIMMVGLLGRNPLVWEALGLIVCYKRILCAIFDSVSCIVGVLLRPCRTVSITSDPSSRNGLGYKGSDKVSWLSEA